MLSGGEVLTADAIYRRAISSDLVVLSACETARGREARGEGVMGLVRGLFFAGTPRVVVSNWRVSDACTRDFMVRFYGNLVTRGLTPGASLREAKLALLHATGERAHPSSWAAFVLWGSAIDRPASAERRAPRPTRRTTPR